MSARALWAVVVMAAFAVGCRSLVDPDSDRRRPPARSLDGRVVAPASIPIGFTQITLTNSAYNSSTGVLAQSAPLSPSGAFSMELPDGLQGYFDLVVEFSSPYGLRSYVFVGNTAADSLLRLELDLVPVSGRLGVPDALQPFDFGPGDLELSRRESRPAGGGEFLRTWSPRIDPSGGIEDVAPRGPWVAKVRTGARGPIGSLETIVHPAYVAGELVAELDLKSRGLDLRLPESWTEPLPITLEMFAIEGGVVRQAVTLGAGGTHIWVTGRWVRAALTWPNWLYPSYLGVVPATADRWTDVESLSRIALHLPPRVLSFRVLDSGAALEGAVVAVYEPRDVVTLRSRADGSCLYLCEDGHRVVKFTHQGRSITRSVIVDGDTEFVVDLTEARRNARD